MELKPGGRRMGKRAFVFTMDAFLAAALLIAGMVLISQYTVQDYPKESMQYVTMDLLNALGEITMSDLDSATFDYYNSSSFYTNPDLSILEQIGTYWAANQTTLAESLADHFLADLLPNSTGFELEMESDSLYMQNISGEENVFAADRMITGVMQGAPLEGSTSSAYLRKITDKRTSSYAYLGGFIGQGNLTFFLEGIPSDVTSSDISGITLEADVGGEMELRINGDYCTDVNASNLSMAPQVWDITGCNASIVSGSNNISLTYTDIDEAYVVGGYVRVDYKTDELHQGIAIDNDTYNFPEIRGIVNLYDAFYIPGNLTKMVIYLHYLADHSIQAFNSTFYLTIGNDTVFTDFDSTTEQVVTLDDPTLQGILNYSEISGRTIPLRMGFENISYSSELLGNSQVALITDVSGSMDWEMGSGSTGTARNCDDSSLNDSTTSRLSIAKCLDKQFAEDVLNITGNTISLVAYATSTVGAWTIPLTTNYTLIENTVGEASPETGYSANGYTCICCGINSARDELVGGASATTLISIGATWLYNTTNFTGPPDNDTEGDAWYEVDYDDSSWGSGAAILGYGAGVTTDLGESSIPTDTEYADLWEHVSDTAGPPNDFTSGTINSTANTYGYAAANDGWDWQAGTFDFDTDVDFNGAAGGQLDMDFRTLPDYENNCGGNDCSGSYAITVNVTPDMITRLANNGSAYLQFYYEWDGNDNPFESNDQVWIKGKWIAPNGTEYWLGSDMDNSHSAGDTDPEIWTVDNPDQDFSGTALYELSDWIGSSGLYYLELGGKLRANSDNEWGDVYFDDIQLKVSNHTDHYYFRRHFTVSDLDDVQRAFFNLLSDDWVTIYLNGNEVFQQTNASDGTYWNRRGVNVAASNFRLGDNVIAVDLVNEGANARFDLELIGVDQPQQGAMLVMTDGQANTECTEQGTTGDLDGDGSSDTASDDAIQAACDARQDWGLQVFAVGFSTDAQEDTLEGMALCGEGIYAKSDNTSALSEFYNEVVINIISATVRSQTVIVESGNLSPSNLYADSNIYYEYDPVIDEPQPNEISVEMQSEQFNSCSPTVSIPQGIRVADAKITSYSGEHWTKTLIVNSQEVYNLTQYNSEYTFLGDPYLIHIPTSVVANGSNTFYIDTGDGPTNSTGCSDNNSFIYTALVPSTTTRSDVVEKTDGCNWSIQFEDDTFSTKLIPSTFSGTKTCTYNATNNTLTAGAYDATDAYDIAVYNLLRALDFDLNGKVFVNLDAEDIEIVITTISAVPYLWGPSIVRAKVWR